MQTGQISSNLIKNSHCIKKKNNKNQNFKATDRPIANQEIPKRPRVNLNNINANQRKEMGAHILWV